LFGDPDFASVLVFRPEKHYVDEKKEERMYHDIQTGRWWWCTQVSRQIWTHNRDKYGSIFPPALPRHHSILTVFRVYRRQWTL
jgi:hypothetical protein